MAIDASVENAIPASASRAAWWAISRAWSSFIRASTSRNDTAWNSWIALPNACRCLAYSTAYSSAARPMPIEFAASCTRVTSNQRMTP